MVVATWAAHRHNGFFIFHEGQGWEYTVSIAVAAWAVAAIGPGEASLDHAIGLDWTAWDGWIGAVIAFVLGVGGGIAQLAICYRPAAGARDDHLDRPTSHPGPSRDRRGRPVARRADARRARLRRVLDLGAVLRLQGVDQQDRRRRVGRAGRGRSAPRPTPSARRWPTSASSTRTTRRWSPSAAT